MDIWCGQPKKSSLRSIVQNVKIGLPLKIVNNCEEGMSKLDKIYLLNLIKVTYQVNFKISMQNNSKII